MNRPLQYLQLKASQAINRAPIFDNNNIEITSIYVGTSKNYRSCVTIVREIRSPLDIPRTIELMPALNYSHKSMLITSFSLIPIDLNNPISFISF